MVSYPNSIPIAIGECVDKINDKILTSLQEYDSNIQTVQYIYGNWKEVCKTLIEYGKNPVLKKQKYPCVLLIEDITIRQSDTDSYGIAPLNIVIAHWTEAKLTSAERETRFANVLRPIYYELRKQIFKHGLFSFYSERQVQADYTEHKYWGVDNATANAVGDYIDAIELTNLRAKINWSWCQQEINENLT